MKWINQSIFGYCTLILLATQAQSDIQATHSSVHRKVHTIALLPGDILNLGINELEADVLKQKSLEKTRSYKNIINRATSGAFVLSVGYATYVQLRRVQSLIARDIEYYNYINSKPQSWTSSLISAVAGTGAILALDTLFKDPTRPKIDPLEIFDAIAYRSGPHLLPCNIVTGSEPIHQAQRAALLAAGAVLSYKYLISPVLWVKSMAVNRAFHMMSGLDVATLDRAFEVIHENANQFCQVRRRGNAISPERTTVVSMQFTLKELGRDIFLYRGFKLSPRELTELSSNRVYIFSQPIACAHNR